MIGSRKDFFDIEPRFVPTSRGAQQVPVWTQQGVMLLALFRGDLEAARGLLAPAFLEPWPIAGGALVVLQACHHQSSSLGPHHEAWIGILARKPHSTPTLARMLLDLRGDDRQGLFLPLRVTSQETASVAVCELFGIGSNATKPCEVAVSASRLTIASELQMTLPPRPRRLGGLSASAPPMALFGMQQGRLVRSLIESDHWVRYLLPVATQLELHQGAFAGLLRELCGENPRPLGLAVGESVRRKLFGCVDQGPLAWPDRAKGAAASS